MREIEIYIHIPFCVRKCSYCDFLSFVCNEQTRQAYVTSLIREIDAWNCGGDVVIPSIFIGGGTPSILEGEDIARILDAVYKKAPLKEDVEITIEANPGTLDERKLSIYKGAGINRISLGLQSANDCELKLLGRIHTWDDFLHSYRAAAAAGFANINVDLMSALPGQTVSSWEATLRRVLALKPQHISAYSLIIEEGTPFFAQYREDADMRAAGEMPDMLPSEEAERQMYEMTGRLLAEQGYQRYEISNYAQPGYRCAHNIGYWQRKEYRGFGLGAASLEDHTRFSNTRDMTAYMDGVWTDRDTVAILSKKEEMEEMMFLGLRMTEGVNREQFASAFSVSMEDIYKDVLSDMKQAGLLTEKSGCIRLSEKGTDLANYVMAQFLID